MIKNCIFINNSATRKSGVIGIISSSHAFIDDCYFENNYVGD